MKKEKTNKYVNRRDFLHMSMAAAASMIFSRLGFSQENSAKIKQLKIGFVGVGNRGSYHLDAALGIEGVVVPAICDINDINLHRAKRWVEEASQPSPRLYGRTTTDFVRMCEQEDLDAVICSTPWKYHAPVCVAGMKNGKNVVSECPIIQTIDEAWELVETFESTGKWATLALEQALLESSYAMAVLNMIRKDMFGEILHCTGGYIHDLRMVKFNPKEEPWRLQHSIDRNGNLYPDHPMNRIMIMMDINHGDRFEYLTSMSTRSVSLRKYAEQHYGENSLYANVPMNQGDYNTTLLHTTGGKMVTLNFDTNSPHPRGIFRVQGTKGVFFHGRGLASKLYIEGYSPEEHRWEESEKYLQEYEHPLQKNYKPPERKAIRGHGSQTTKTPLTWHLLVNALRNGKMPFFDVYDSVTSSAISPLSEMSVAKKSQPVEFPDFTKGKWESRQPISFDI